MVVGVERGVPSGHVANACEDFTTQHLLVHKYSMPPWWSRIKGSRKESHIQYNWDLTTEWSHSVAYLCRWSWVPPVICRLWMRIGSWLVIISEWWWYWRPSSTQYSLWFGSNFEAIALWRSRLLKMLAVSSYSRAKCISIFSCLLLSMQRCECVRQPCTVNKQHFEFSAAVRNHDFFFQTVGRFSGRWHSPTGFPSKA